MMMAWYMVYDDETLNELCLLLAEVYLLDEIGSLVHAELVTMVKIFCLHMVLHIMVMLDHMDDCSTLM